MSSDVLPYTVQPHPVTGIYSGKLGIWVFLASEVMLFGALFSSYILLRVGSPDWLEHGEHGLSVPIGMFNTLVLISSSVTMVMAWAACKMGDLKQCRVMLLITVVLAVIFLVVKLKFEYAHKIHDHIYPSTHTFYALYYTMTGLHGLHILGGILVIGYLLGPGAKLYAKDPDYYANRIECTGLYWHFVDLVWIFLFPVFYLL